MPRFLDRFKSDKSHRKKKSKSKPPSDSTAATDSDPDEEPADINDKAQKDNISSPAALLESEGLSCLYEPGDKSAIEVDIVAVHGLLDGPFRAWTHKSSGNLWLRDPEFLPAMIPTARIWSYGYNSSVALSQSIAGVNDFAKTLLEWLEQERQEEVERRRPIVFICHSLGGIVVKKIVDEGSATLNLINEKVYPSAANHRTICKFASNSANDYKFVARAIKILVAGVINDDKAKAQKEGRAGGSRHEIGSSHLGAAIMDVEEAEDLLGPKRTPPSSPIAASCTCSIDDRLFTTLMAEASISTRA